MVKEWGEVEQINRLFPKCETRCGRRSEQAIIHWSAYPYMSDLFKVEDSVLRLSNQFFSEYR